MQTGARSGTGGARLADGGSATAPSSGITTITSADGTVVITNPNGPITDLSVPGANVRSWLEDEAVAIAALLGVAAVKNQNFNDFDGSLNYIPNPDIGTIVQGLDSGCTGGVIDIDSPSGGFPSMNSGIGVEKTVIVGLPGVDPWAISCRFQVFDIAFDDNGFFCGLLDVQGPAIHGIGFQLNGSAAALLVRGDSSLGGNTVATTFVPTDATWINLRIVCDGTNLTAYINGVSVGTTTLQGSAPSMWYLGFNNLNHSPELADAFTRIDKLAVFSVLAA